MANYLCKLRGSIIEEGGTCPTNPSHTEWGRIEGPVIVSRIGVKGFRGIREGELELAPLTILLGPNNSGKSAMLEALLMVSNPFFELPYFINGSKASVINTLRYRHSTLESRGFDFLFYRYISPEARIAWNIGGVADATWELFLRRDEDRGDVYHKGEYLPYYGASHYGVEVIGSEWYCRLGFVKLSNGSETTAYRGPLAGQRRALLLSPDLLETSYGYIED